MRVCMCACVEKNRPARQKRFEANPPVNGGGRGKVLAAKTALPGQVRKRAADALFVIYARRGGGPGGLRRARGNHWRGCKRLGQKILAEDLAEF